MPPARLQAARRRVRAGRARRPCVVVSTDRPQAGHDRRRTAGPAAAVRRRGSHPAGGVRRLAAAESRHRATPHYGPLRLTTEESPGWSVIANFTHFAAVYCQMTSLTRPRRVNPTTPLDVIAARAKRAYPRNIFLPSIFLPNRLPKGSFCQPRLRSSRPPGPQRRSQNSSPALSPKFARRRCFACSRLVTSANIGTLYLAHNSHSLLTSGRSF